MTGDGWTGEQILWKQKRAAMVLDVSVSWLRASDCPKYLLPGNGPGRKRVVRYKPEEVRAWVEHQRRGNR
jgi:hypothetical protein